MKALYSALLKCQGLFPVIPKGKTAVVPTKAGGKYTYTYADLGSVIDAVSPILAGEGLGIIHVGNGNKLTTTLFHSETGEKIDSTFDMPMSDDPQDMGAVITYFRRYAVCALLGIVTEDDTDGSVKPKVAAKPQEPAGVISEAQARRLFAVANKYKLSDDDVKAMAIAAGHPKGKTRAEMTWPVYKRLIDSIEKLEEKKE